MPPKPCVGLLKLILAVLGKTLGDHRVLKLDTWLRLRELRSMTSLSFKTTLKKRLIRQQASLYREIIFSWWCSRGQVSHPLWIDMRLIRNLLKTGRAMLAIQFKAMINSIHHRPRFLQPFWINPANKSRPILRELISINPSKIFLGRDIWLPRRTSMRFMKMKGQVMGSLRVTTRTTIRTLNSRSSWKKSAGRSDRSHLRNRYIDPWAQSLISLWGLFTLSRYMGCLRTSQIRLWYLQLMTVNLFKAQSWIKRS